MPAQLTSWTETYRPETLDQVVGNPSAVRELRAWGEAWTQGRPDKPGAILVGEAGIGKTSAAHALAGELGWSVVELNASDARNKGAIEKVVTRGAVSRGFSATGEYEGSDAKRKLIILDEADNVFGREDRGGMQQIVDTLKRTHQPIVLTANDGYALSRKSRALKKLCVEIKFQRIKASTVAKALARICKAEGIETSFQALEALADHSGGDLRAAVNDLEALAQGQEALTMADVETLGYRDARTSIFDALGTILSTMEVKEAREVTRELDEDPESLLLWVEENAPREYTDPEDRARAMAILGRADEFLGATRRTQYYRFWAVASDLMTGGVALAKRRKYTGWTRYQFPTWLRKMSRSKAARSLREDLGTKVGAEYHAGTATAAEHIIPMLSFVAKRHRPLAVHITAVLDLNGAELALLLDTKASTKKVKSILEDAEELAETMATPAGANLGGVSFPSSASESPPTAQPTGESAAAPAAAPEEPSEDEEEPEANAEADDEDEDGESQASLFEF